MQEINLPLQRQYRTHRVWRTDNRHTADLRRHDSQWVQRVSTVKTGRSTGWWPLVYSLCESNQWTLRKSPGPAPPSLGTLQFSIVHSRDKYIYFGYWLFYHNVLCRGEFVCIELYLLMCVCFLTFITLGQTLMLSGALDIMGTKAWSETSFLRSWLRFGVKC